MDGAVELGVASVVRESVLGGITVISIALAIWAIRQLTAVQNARVTDVSSYAERLEKSAEKDRETQLELAISVNTLAEATRENTKALERLAIANDTNTRALDGVVREALSGRRATGLTPQPMRRVRTSDPEGAK